MLLNHINNNKSNNIINLTLLDLLYFNCLILLYCRHIIEYQIIYFMIFERNDK